ncbi:MAG TPA: glycosyltransferase [Xanthobacteraceae bacterium]|nr:glycosyltransferase [Xanthobacteraceae bacterium]
MALTILSVAYPFAPVGPDAVGGAEQILSEIDSALTRAGHRSIVVACEGSGVAGIHVPVPRAPRLLGPGARRLAHENHRHAIATALDRWDIDVVHLHGLDFHAYLPPPGPAALVTLHLPVTWYPPECLRPARPQTWFNCVSRSQHANCPGSLRLLDPIENGVAETFLAARHAKRRFALTLSRICPEKGIHLAIDAAKHAGIPLLIAGEVFPYQAHQRYFAELIAPRLDRWRRFIGPVRLARKRRLLAAARCVLIPSLAAETASLVAREALAAGTPVIAFARGALVEALDHGRTGFLVENEAQMARAIARLDEIDPARCRQAARERFSSGQMLRSYVAAYRALRTAEVDHAAKGAA